MRQWLNAGWLAPEGCWDQTMLRDLIDGDLFPHGLTFRHWTGYPRADGAVITCPSRYWVEHVDRINEALTFYSWVLFITTSDEEQLFDCTQVVHDNIRFWIQTPRKGVEYPEGARFFGVGYTPHFRCLPAEPPVKGLDVVLAAQATHSRRRAAFDALQDVQGTKLVYESAGFTQGLPVKDYVASMLQAKVAPCPSGAVSPDSFRLWEALEAHTVPVADKVSPVDGETEYWERVCEAPAFPVYTDCLASFVADELSDWPASANRVTAWWMRQKRDMATALKADLSSLGAL